jgi:5-(carboxyamino)imidazole ribonucleotide synthase
VTNQPLADTDVFGFSGMLNLVGENNYSGKVKYEGLKKF